MSDCGSSGMDATRSTPKPPLLKRVDELEKRMDAVEKEAGDDYVVRTTQNKLESLKKKLEELLGVKFD